MSWYVETKDFEEELLNYKYEILIKQGIQKCIDLVNDKNKQINNLKLCNSDYYNQICTLSSKLSLINNYINEDKNCIPKHINDYINKIIFDKNIKLGSDK